MATVSPTKKLMKTPAKPAAAAAPAAPAAPAVKTPAVKKVAAKTAAPVEKEAEAATDTTVNVVESAEVDSADVIVQTAHEIENLKEGKAFTLVPSLMGDIDRNYFKLGGILSKISREGWFQNKGYDNFKAYVEAECSIKYRKAMYLINIYNGLVESGVPWVKVAHLGWTKLKELANQLTPENVDEWVTLAEGMTSLQLIEYIAKHTQGSDAASGTEGAQEDAKKVMTMTFKLHKDQKETVTAALDKAKHATGTEFSSAALEFICIDFLGGTPKVANLPDLMKTKALEDVLQALQEAFPTLVMQASVYNTIEEATAAQAEIDKANAEAEGAGEPAEAEPAEA